MTRTRLERLAALAEMLRARDMARLGQLARQRQELADRLDQLSTRVELTEDPALNAARLAHAAWAQEQRIRLNQTLARQNAKFIEQRTRTAQSVGRTHALEKLRKPAR